MYNIRDLSKIVTPKNHYVIMVTQKTRCGDKYYDFDSKSWITIQIQEEGRLTSEYFVVCRPMSKIKNVVIIE